MEFYGYRRKEGRPGIRNHVLILPACACGSESCRIVASQVRGAVNIVFNTGCSDVAANTEMSQKIHELANGRLTKAEAYGFSDIAIDHVCRFV